MGQSPTTHPRLLVRLRDPTDRDAWERFVELYAPVIYGFFRKRSLQDADAADLTQDVLQVVAKGAKSFVHDGAEGAFRGWLCGIARHKLQHFLTRRERKEQVSGDPASLERMEAVPAPDDDARVWERKHERRVFAWAAEHVRARVDPSTWQAFLEPILVRLRDELILRGEELGHRAVVRVQEVRGQLVHEELSVGLRPLVRKALDELFQKLL